MLYLNITHFYLVCNWFFFKFMANNRDSNIICWVLCLVSEQTRYPKCLRYFVRVCYSDTTFFRCLSPLDILCFYISSWIFKSVFVIFLPMTRARLYFAPYIIVNCVSVGPEHLHLMWLLDLYGTAILFLTPSWSCVLPLSPWFLAVAHLTNPEPRNHITVSIMFK